MVVEYKHRKLKKIGGEHRPSPNSLPANEENETQQVEVQRLQHANEKAVMERAPETSVGVLEASPGSGSPDLTPSLLR